MKNNVLAAFAVMLAAALLDISCKTNSGPSTTVDPCPYDPLIVYGTGSATATVPGAGGLFSATGPYKPSAQFGSDSLPGQGAGGFLHDTLVARDTLSARLCAFQHALHQGVLLETILVVTLHDTTGSIDTGSYRIIKKGTPGGRRTATIDYILSDSTHFIPAQFASDSGSLSVTEFDPCAHHITATFSGRLYDTSSPSTKYSIENGSFAITFVGRYFAW